MVNKAYYETVFPLEQHKAIFKDALNIDSARKVQSHQFSLNVLVFPHTDLYRSCTYN